jgi:hypothetical protein
LQTVFFKGFEPPVKKLKGIFGTKRPFKASNYLRKGRFTSVHDGRKSMNRQKRNTAKAENGADRSPQPFAVHNGGQGGGAFSMESLFHADILIQSQYAATYQRRFQQEPEKVLMLALLEDAIICFQDYLGTDCKRKMALFQDAEAWILDDDTSYIFSFVNICEVLGFDASYLREGLMRWKKAALSSTQAKEPRKRLAS